MVRAPPLRRRRRAELARLRALQRPSDYDRHAAARPGRRVRQHAKPHSAARSPPPPLDRLASGGARLTRVYASAPLTLPSHASILTAVSPPVHGLRANGLFRLGPNLPTLATILKGAGYRTGAFVGAFVLDARFGLNRGFDVYDDRYGEKPTNDPAEGAERRAEDVIRPAAAWIT